MSVPLHQLRNQLHALPDSGICAYDVAEEQAFLWMDDELRQYRTVQQQGQS